MKKFFEALGSGSAAEIPKESEDDDHAEAQAMRYHNFLIPIDTHIINKT